MVSLDISPGNGEQDVPVNVELAQWLGGHSLATVRREPSGGVFVTLNCANAHVRSLLYSTSRRVRTKALVQLLQKSVGIHLQ